MTKLALLLLLPLTMPRSVPRRALLLRRAVGVEVVELAAGKHLAAPLAVFFLMGPLNPLLFLQRRLRFRRPLALSRRSCLERLESVATRGERHHAAVQGIEADRALLHACAASEDRRGLDLVTVKLSSV